MSQASDTIKDKDHVRPSVQYMRDIILNWYQPAREDDYDFHMNTRQLFMLLDEQINLTGLAESDLSELLKQEGFICIELTGPFQFTWLFKRKQPVL